MIELAAGSSLPAGLAHAGRALLARFGAPAEPAPGPAPDTPGRAPDTGPGAEAEPAPGSAAAWVETLVSRLAAVDACTAVEHLFGVLPLLDAFFAPRPAVAAVARADRIGSLGLFTPAPELGWEAAAVAAEPAGQGLLLSGEIRIPAPVSDGSLALARVDGGRHRLVWLDHGAGGVERRGSRQGGPVAGDGPCWLACAGAAVGPELISTPVTLAPGGDLCRRLEHYAGLWALAAAILAREGVRALRRAARTTTHRGTAFGASQLVAMGITELEIEAELALAAARADLDSAGRGLAVATAAARVLSAVAARTAELRDRLGLAVAGPLAGDGTARSLTAFLGGAAMLESELARALGAGDPLPAEEAGA
jgi:hypothetical protein